MNVIICLTILTLLFVSVVKAHPKSAIKLPVHSSKRISASVFTCDSSDVLLNTICQVGLHKINSELAAAGISITRDGVLFKFDDDKDKRIDTGHSCSVTAEIRHQHATAKLSSSARLDFSGDSLTEPFAISLQLPVSVSARIDVKQRFGARLFFGSCSNFASDSYSFRGSFSTTADVVIGISLNPSLGVVGSGDYALVIEPKLAVLTRLRSTNIQFKVSGVSPITPVLTFITGVSSTLLKSATAIFTGDSISDIIGNAAAFDFGVPLVLGLGALPRPLEDAIFSRLLNVVEHKIEKRSKGFGPDLEDKLEADLWRALKLRTGGKRVFIIKRDVVNLVRSAGIVANVFIDPPIDPSIECKHRERTACESRDVNVIIRQCIPLGRTCSNLRREHEKKYEPTSVIPSKPKIASRAPLVAPTPTPTRNRACLQQANQLCSECRGCQRCVELIRRC